jgi:hypothetical protein
MKQQARYDRIRVPSISLELVPPSRWDAGWPHNEGLESVESTARTADRKGDGTPTPRTRITHRLATFWAEITNLCALWRALVEGFASHGLSVAGGDQTLSTPHLPTSGTRPREQSGKGLSARICNNSGVDDDNDRCAFAFPAGLLSDSLLAAGLGNADAIARLPPWDVGSALHAMDRLRIETAMLSIPSPVIHFGDANAARELAWRVNEEAARLTRTYPRCVYVNETCR